MALSLTVRVAEPGEIDEAVSIDDDATQLDTQGGVLLTLAATDPFVVAEQARWLRSAQMRRLFFAIDERDQRVGFAALDVLDGVPYLDQLAVRTGAMRRGIGRLLLHHAIAWAQRHGGDALWLTTYDHVPWNRPFYEREGFVVVADAHCGPAVLHHLEAQRRWLPAPDQRIAMRHPIASR